MVTLDYGAQQPMFMAAGNIGAHFEVLSGNQWVEVADWFVVAPGSRVRLVATGTGYLQQTARVRIWSDAGMVYDGTPASFGNSAFVEFQLPGDDPQNYYGRVDQDTDFAQAFLRASSGMSMQLLNPMSTITGGGSALTAGPGMVMTGPSLLTMIGSGAGQVGADIGAVPGNILGGAVKGVGQGLGLGNLGGVALLVGLGIVAVLILPKVLEAKRV